MKGIALLWGFNLNYLYPIKKDDGDWDDIPPLIVESGHSKFDSHCSHSSEVLVSLEFLYFFELRVDLFDIVSIFRFEFFKFIGFWIELSLLNG